MRVRAPLDPVFDREEYRSSRFERGVGVVVILAAICVALNMHGLAKRYPEATIGFVVSLVAAALWAFHRAFSALVLTRDKARVGSLLWSRSTNVEGVRTAWFPRRTRAANGVFVMIVATPLALAALGGVTELAVGQTRFNAQSLGIIATAVGKLGILLVFFAVARAVFRSLTRRHGPVFYDARGMERLRLPEELDVKDEAHLRQRLRSLGIRATRSPPPAMRSPRVDA